MTGKTVSSSENQISLTEALSKTTHLEPPIIPSFHYSIIPMNFHRFTTAQAIIQFLLQQHVERDRRRQPFFAGCLGIFGHGCIAGIGQALLQYPKFRYINTKNEQASVHIAAAYAKMSNRLRAFACVSSIGPGSRPTWSRARRSRLLIGFP